MIINELEGVYGKATDEEKQWISENLEKLDYEVQTKYLTQLHKIHTNGFPDVGILKNLLTRITGKQSKQYIWAVCLECGCEYDYRLPMCPNCYDNNLECRAKAVKKSEFQPPFKVIRYNKQYLNGEKNEKICYSCESKKESYCKHFGQTKWNCRREEFESCECRTCCAIAKKANKVLEGNKEIKSGYAIPLKRG